LVHITIKTDHKSLKNLLTQAIQTPEQQVFLCKLLGYDFSIVYKPGKENLVVDALSRNFEEEVLFTSSSLGVSGSLLALSQPIYTLREKIKTENQNDPKTKEMIEKYSKAEEDSMGYMVRNGNLYFRDRLYLNEHSNIIKKYCLNCMTHSWGGHSGINRT